MPPWFTCQGPCLSTCQKHANFSFLRTNVLILMPTCHKLCQCFLWSANVLNGLSIFQLDVPACQNPCQYFKNSSYKMLREISILYYYIKKFCIVLGITVILIICICIVHKNYIILHLYISGHIKERSVKFSLVRNENINIKRPGFYALQVKSVFSNFPRLTQLKKTKNTCKYCDLLEWRST